MKVLKVTGTVLLVILIILSAAGIYLSKALPDTGAAPSLRIEGTQRQIERGKYLAHHVAVCMDCHSTRDWSLYSGPIAGTALGGGGERFTREMGFPGTFYAPNITPYALAKWTDGEIFRAITTGVSKDERALFPVMAYHRFGKMDAEDIYSIIAYLRTLQPVQNDVPKSAADFPVSFLINTMPQEAAFTKLPDVRNVTAYGGYLVNAAGCVDCHSKTDKGKVIPGTEFGGGMEFSQPAGILISPNITFDRNTGIGNWTKDAFIHRFQQFADSNYQPTTLKADQINTLMPWTMYGGMSKEDLGAIYDYLGSLAPVTH